MTRLKFSVAISILFLTTSARSQQPRRTFTAPPLPTTEKVAAPSWSFLSLHACAIDTFLMQHPKYDGRGVIVIIFDTGIDPGISGLLTTSTDKTKIIDLLDYSKTGDVLYSDADRSGDELKIDGHTVLKGLNALQLKPWNNKYYYGFLPERRFKNGLADLNFNGSTDDIFGVLIFEDAPNHYVAYVDSDGDRDLSNEHPLSDYHEHHAIFSFHSIDTTKSSGRRLNGAVNIFPDEHRISLFFDDGSHGTHVAGIAAGHNIDNQSGFNGVAPGAELIGIKFSNNADGGVTISGSMKRAFEFAANLAKSQPKPVVVNMSFGIGSEIEGKSEMDLWLDSLLTATPNLTVCIAAGNEGPGLSSIGLPGTADQVITSGAALPDDAARDLYSVMATKPVLFDFSSRGGELAKPDIITPGTAVSTVPDYVGGDRYNGTSMASPYTAGCSALLLSAMSQQFQDYTPNAFEVKRALMLSATPLLDLTPLDQGFGLVNVPRAYELLSRWHREGIHPDRYQIETTIPNLVASGPAAYFRNGLYSKNGEHQQFFIHEVATSHSDQRTTALGMKAYDLVSDEPWLVPVQKSIYHRGDQGMSVSVTYKPELLQKPGLYVGRIRAYPKNAADHKPSASQFELLNTIVVPNQFKEENNYSVSVASVPVASGKTSREFFNIPAGAKLVKFFLSSPDADGYTTAHVFDADGHSLGAYTLREAGKGRMISFGISGERLHAGVLELDLSRGVAGEDLKPTTVDISAQAYPLDYSLQSTNFPHRPAVLTLSNGGTSDLELSSISVAGYERLLDTVVASGDSLVYPIVPRQGEHGANLKIELTPTSYNLFTDIACQVLRNDSVTVVNNAFDDRQKSVHVEFANSDTLRDNLKLVIVGGYALPERHTPWRVRIRDERETAPISIDFNTSLSTLSPGSTLSHDLIAPERTIPAPEGFRYYGVAKLSDTKQSTFELPLDF